MAKMRKIAATEDVYTAWSKKVKPDSKTFFHLPKQYKEFKDVFEKESNTTALPSHQLWDHKIKLEEGKQPTKHLIYLLSEFKLETLRSYLDKNLWRGLIREPQSPAGYPVLFAPKPGRGLRMYVDY